MEKNNQLCPYFSQWYFSDRFWKHYTKLNIDILPSILWPDWIRLAFKSVNFKKINLDKKGEIQ